MNHVLLIGINEYKDLKNLKGCYNDVQLAFRTFETKLTKESHSIKKLINDSATKNNIYANLAKIAVEAKDGDTVFIHYSGHGAQTTDYNNDEIDKWDEAICPYDSSNSRPESFITDDFIREYFIELFGNKKINLLIILDTCFSGGMYDHSKTIFGKNLKGINENIKVCIVSLSSDNSLAEETKYRDYHYGILSYTLYQTILFSSTKSLKYIMFNPTIFNKVKYKLKDEKIKIWKNYDI